MKVLHCAESIQGGVASYLRELLRLQRGDLGAGSIGVVVPASQVGELPVPEGVWVETYSDHRGRAGNALALAGRVLACTRRSAPQVVHIHGTYAGASIRPALALAASQVRVVYCPHGWAFDRPLSRLGRHGVRLVEAVLANLTEHVVCISAHELRSALAAGIRRDRLRLVVNGVADTRPASAGETPQWKNGRTRVLFVGRLDRQKGADVLFAALDELGDRVDALVAGDRVLADIEPLDPPANTTMIGWLKPERLEGLFESADVLVVPSRWEGFGLIAAEALRAGLPVIASRIGGLPEIVEDGVCGVLVEPGSAAAIVHAIATHSRADWARLGRNGPDRVRRLFSMERVHRQLLDLYGMTSNQPIPTPTNSPPPPSRDS